MPKPYRIDGHAHVFHRKLKLDPARRYAPDYDATLDDYLSLLDAHGFTHGVLVQPSFLGEDNSYLIDCLARAPKRLRGVAVVAQTIGQEELDRLKAAGIIGLRLNLVGVSMPALNANFIRLVSRLGLQIQIQCMASGLAPLAERLIDQGIIVVADHFGLPDPALGVDDPAFRRLLALGRSGRLRMKFSAAYRASADPVHFAARAYPRMVEALGTGNIIWGSDWPHTRYEVRENFAVALDVFEAASPNPQERAQVLSSMDDLFD